MEQGKQQLMASSSIPASKPKRFAAAAVLLTSALVFAAQPGGIPSYDELIKGSIYDSTNRWRAVATLEINEWRAPHKEVEGRIVMGNDFIHEEARERQDREAARSPFEYHNSAQGYRLFKIDF